MFQPSGQPLLPNNMDPSRPGEAGDFVTWQGGPPGIGMSPRMNPPRGMGPYGPPSMRGPPPGGPGMPPMVMSGGRPQWHSTSQPMNYSSSSPGNYGPPGGQPGPGTPIMPSPQDSSNSGGENMYTLMKPVSSGNMSVSFISFSFYLMKTEKKIYFKGISDEWSRGYQATYNGTGYKR